MSLDSQNHEDRKLANQSRRANFTRSLDLPDSGIRGQNRLKGRISIQSDHFVDSAPRNFAVTVAILIFVITPVVVWAVVKLKESLHN